MQNPAIQQIDLVERQFNQVAAFLAAGDAPHLQAATALLQILSVELVRLLPPQNKAQANQVELHKRVLAMAKGLHMLRDNLSRQAAANQARPALLTRAGHRSTDRWPGKAGCTNTWRPELSLCAERRKTPARCAAFQRRAVPSTWSALRYGAAPSVCESCAA